MMKTRFAPSPTGLIHAGNVRVAILNYLLAKKNNGIFVLRIDDTDTERSTKEFESAIIKDLEWLGIEWQEFYRQSERHEIYEQGIKKLKSDGRLYACYETAEELDLKRKSSNIQVYDRAGLRLSNAKKFEYEQMGRKPHWRFLLNDIDVAWHDLGAGDLKFQAGNVSDPVLIRSDNRPLYTISSVIDDGVMGVSCILRGEDHITNTAAQVQLFQALGYTPPQFAHFPRMMAASGEKLSKRMGSLSITDLRQAAIVPDAVVAYLGRMGSNIAGSVQDSWQVLLAGFDLQNYGRAAPKFLSEELEILSMKFLHQMSFNQVQKYCTIRNITGVDEKLWQLLSANINHLDELTAWQQNLNGIFPDATQRDFLNICAQLLPSEFNQENLKNWLNHAKETTNRKGKELFHPIRHALTGREDGPTIPAIMIYLGRDACIGKFQA